MPETNPDSLIQSTPISLGKPIDYNNWSGTESPLDYLQKTKEMIGGISNKPNASTVTPISPNLIDISGRYPTQNIGYNNEELYAEGQGFLSKLGNATAKMAGIATNTFIEGTAGTIYGTYKGISDGKLSSFYDNEFSRALDEKTKDLENMFPNYYTEAEKNRDWDSVSNVFQNLTSSNFLFDGILKNFGFILGMAATAGTYSGVLKAVRAASKMTAAGELGQALAVADDVVRGEKYASIGSRFGNALKGAGDFISKDPAQRFIISALSTSGEAKMEALQTALDYKKNLVDDYKVKNGVEPTGEELKKIEDLTAGAGDSVFGLNVALLTVSNYLVLPKILGSSYNVEKGIYNGIKTKAIARGEGGLYETVAEAPLFGKKIQSAQNIASMFISPREGLEEGSQFAVGVGVDNYYNKKYEGKDVSIVKDLFGAGVKETLTTKEGKENIIIGALSGGLTETALGRKQKKAENLAQAALLDADTGVNNSPILKFTQFTKETVESLDRHVVLEAEKAAYVRQGDVLEVKEKEQDIAHNYLVPRIKFDRFDLVTDDINNYRKILSSTTSASCASSGDLSKYS